MSLYWTGPRMWEAQCLLPWLPLTYGITLEATPQSPLPCLSLEAQIGQRKLWGSGDAAKLLDPLVGRLIADRTSSTPAAFLSYSPAATTCRLSEHYLWTAPSSLLALWNDKIQSSRWMRSCGLPTVPSVHFADGRFPAGDSLLVMQQLHGSCGSTTYIGNSNALGALHSAMGCPHVRLTPLIDGHVVNGHVFVMPTGEISVASPSLQLVSPDMLGGVCQPLYAGNDFAAYKRSIPDKIRKTVLQLFQKIGALAARAGYHGMLGADLIYSPADSSVCFLEINPRMQGSTGLLSMLEASAGNIPSAALFFMSLLEGKIEQKQGTCSFLHNEELPSAQFILRQGIRTDFLSCCHKSILVDESPSTRVECRAATHRYLTNFPRPTIHHDTMGNIFKWAQKMRN